jgi:hypothetical protein
MTRTISTTFTHLLTLSTLVLGCTGSVSDGDEPIRSQCSPDAASIESSVFKASCDGGGCHGTETPAVGLTLVGAAPDRLMGMSSVLCSGWAMVVPGSPDKSLLYQKLLRTPPCGERMPLAGHLPEGDVECVRGWIAGLAGAGGCETCGGSECVTLASDAANCGQCGNACPQGVTCENGSCACPAGQTGCGDSCVDISTDVENCGGCGRACSPGSTCAAGQCSCPASLSSCGDTCADLQSDAEHCGRCGGACASGQVCLAGACADGCGSLTQCGSACVDLSSSALNCGACDNACPGSTACVSGKCECPGGGKLCGTACVDTATDAANCGGCGVACGAGEGCVAGVCQCVSTRSVSFKADVEPILSSGCTANGCHTGAKPKENLTLVSGKVYGELVNVATSQCSGKRKLVVPGSPSTSYLMQKLLNVDICTGTQMPKANATIPTKDLDTISSWICAGAPND